MGYDFVCALLDDSSVNCWGGNTYSQLGSRETTWFQTPVW